MPAGDYVCVTITGMEPGTAGAAVQMVVRADSGQEFGTILLVDTTLNPVGLYQTICDHVKQRLNSLFGLVVPPSAWISVVGLPSTSPDADNGFVVLDSTALVPFGRLPVGAGASQVAAGNDARLSDARVPIAHGHFWGDIGGTPNTLTGYGISDGVMDTDARLSDARTPTAHAGTHVTGGSDVIPNALPSGGAGLMSGADKAKLNGITSGANLYVHPNHTGDVTSDADGAQTIAAGAVTYAKIQNVSAANKLLGRAGAGAGDVEEITCTAAGRALIDDPDAAAQRTTLGLGTLATQSGAFSGTSSGTNTGDQTTITGNAGTATALQTARTINGVSFDGTADITVAAAGSTLTGTTIAAGMLGTTSTTACAGNDSRLSNSRTPTVHATSHKSGGSDAIKLDELAAPTDITTLDATSTQHGLCPKLSGSAATYLNGTGAFSTPVGGGGAANQSLHVVLLHPLTTASAVATNLAANTVNAVSDPNLRQFVDLRSLTKCKIMGRIGGSINPANKLRIQYHTGNNIGVSSGDAGWTTLADTAGSHTLNTLFQGAETAVPAGAQIQTCLIRAVLFGGDGVADPTISCCIIEFYP